MAIGSLPRFLPFGCITLALAGLALPLKADQIVFKAGTATAQGQITGVSNRQVMFTTANGKVPFNLDLIQSVTMAEPPAMAGLKGAPPATVASTLAPLIQQYAGLPADWVLDAMGQLADAYMALNQNAQAAAVYAQITKLYPNSAYQSEAVAGEAKLALLSNKIDTAMNLVKPLIDKADKNIAPSPSEGRLGANAFLVYGQVLQAKGQLPQALEAYLTVETMFYQNPALVAQAEQLTAALRKEHPDVRVD